MAISPAICGPVLSATFVIDNDGAGVEGGSAGNENSAKPNCS